jgi:hypothetical protein
MARIREELSHRGHFILLTQDMGFEDAAFSSLAVQRSARATSFSIRLFNVRFMIWGFFLIHIPKDKSIARLSRARNGTFQLFTVYVVTRVTGGAKPIHQIRSLLNSGRN